MKSPEGHEKDAIDRYLDSIGCWHFRPFMSGFGKSGVPDIVCCIRGRFISIEVKREGKEPTKLQDTRMTEIRNSGGYAVWGTAMRVIPQLENLVNGRILP